MKRLLPGYTLIELMITISIVSLIITLGISAYRKAQDRQIGQSGAELILSTLQENQKSANIGKKDCEGKYAGQRVVMSSGASTMTATSLCEGGVEGTPVVTTIPGITFNSSNTITFNPLSLGMNLGGGSQLLLNFTSSSGTVYQIKLMSSGTIAYEGVQ